MQKTLLLPLPPDIPSFAETLTALRKVPLELYQGLEHAIYKDRSYQDAEFPYEREPYFSAPMVRVHLRKFLRRAGIDATEDSYSWTMDPVSNIGISFLFDRMSIKVLKGDGILPGCGTSKKKRKFYNQVGTYFLDAAKKTLGTSPAVKVGLTDHIWSVEEIVALLEKSEPKSTRPARVAVSN